jgi:predicted TIM-barrel fold metal-dependent hydrolase
MLVSYYKPAKYIDFHVHIFPDDVAPKAMDMFRLYNRFETLGDGAVAGTLAIMDEMGIDVCVSQPVATSPAQVRSINNWSVSIRSDRLIPYGAMHPEFTGFREEMDRLLDLGFTGFKFQPGWQDFYPDEERLFPIYEAAEGRLAILFHAGYELNTALVVKGLVPCFRKVHDRFPNLTMILAHMGGYRQWEEAESLLWESGIYFDISYCPEDELSDDEMVRLIRKQGADKILFGTDFPLRSPREDAERLARLDLTPEEKDLIAFGNAERLLGV